MESTTLNMTYGVEPELTDTFQEQVAEWCFENEVPYETEVVDTFLSWLTEENFEERFRSCTEYLQHG